LKVNWRFVYKSGYEVLTSEGKAFKKIHETEKRSRIKKKMVYRVLGAIRNFGVGLVGTV